MRSLRSAIRRMLPGRDHAAARTPKPLVKNPDAQLKLTFDDVLSRLILNEPKGLYFVQVGAFDGVSGDPLHPYVKRGLLSGCLVEPQADAFERLQRNYEGVEGVRLKRAAIASKSGESTLYRVRPGTVGPEWLFQIASFSREVLLKHAPLVPGLEQAIITETVPTITFDQLTAELPETPSIVVIDTEGYDFEVIKLLNVKVRKPRLILYEHKHLTPADQDACLESLIAAGYQVAVLTTDTIARLSEGPADPAAAS